MWAAYDYDRGEWIVGSEAVPLLKAQLEEELAVLTSDRGGEYLAFTGNATALPDAIEKCREALERLEYA